MKKIFIFAFCMAVCYTKVFALSHKDLKDVFDGTSYLYVINVTKQGTDNLSIDEIESLFKTLQKNMPEKEPCFIVFNEYFFGKEPLDIEIKKALLRWFDKIENAIFVVNFVQLQEKLICVYEIDRIANIVYNSMVHEQLLAQKLQIPQQKGYMFSLGSNIKERFSYAYSGLQFAQKSFNSSFEIQCPENQVNNEITNYLSYLKQLLETIKTEFVETQCLENVTFYYHKNIPLMKYNKATYYNEIFNLNQSEFIYLFGIGSDLVVNFLNPIAEILYKNVSTEICRDICVGVRKANTISKNLHIIQSNTIQAEKYKQHIPKSKYLILSDPNYNKCFQGDDPLSISFTFKDSKILKSKKNIIFNIFKLNFNQI